MRRPSPSPQRCFVDTPDGRLLFDVRQDHGSARLVPPEAFRRWRADLRAREEWRQRETAAQIASHAHKKQVVADWVAQYGTPQQQARHAAGVLPIEEVIEAMTDQAFDAGNRFERYAFDGAARLSCPAGCFVRKAGICTPAQIPAARRSLKATAPLGRLPGPGRAFTGPVFPAADTPTEGAIR